MCACAVVANYGQQDTLRPKPSCHFQGARNKSRFTAREQFFLRLSHTLSLTHTWFRRKFGRKFGLLEYTLEWVNTFRAVVMGWMCSAYMKNMNMEKPEGGVLWAESIPHLHIHTLKSSELELRNFTVFGDNASKEIIKLNKVIRMGSSTVSPLYTSPIPRASS